MTDNRMGDDDDDGGVGSQQPGDAALLPHYIPYRLRKILRSRASLHHSSADVDSEVLTGVHVNEEEEATWNTPAD